MWLRSGFSIEPAAASGLKPLRRFPRSDLRTFLFLRPHFPKATSQSFPKLLHRTTPMREMKLQDLKAQTPAELASLAEEKGVENATTRRNHNPMLPIPNHSPTQ